MVSFSGSSDLLFRFCPDLIDFVIVRQALRFSCGSDGSVSRIEGSQPKVISLLVTGCLVPIAVNWRKEARLASLACIALGSDQMDLMADWFYLFYYWLPFYYPSALGQDSELRRYLSGEN